MKKLLFGIGILFIISACNQTDKKSYITQKEPNQNNTSKIRMALNGYTYDIANKMVARFRNDSTSSDTATAIWLSKEWVDTVATLLDSEKADGFRIYFAKIDTGKMKGKNTVIIVSTKDDGTDNSAESGSDHTDYFAHDFSFLGTTAALPTEEYTPNPGATLYSNPNCNGSCQHLGPNHISCQNASTAVKLFGKTKINTRAEWFSICFIDYLKNQLNDPKNVMADGIRIYFAYHNKTTNPSHRNKHAFVIVQTQTVIINGKTIHRRDNYKCYTAYNCKNKFVGDNGEQCLNNCTGAQLPQ